MLPIQIACHGLEGGHLAPLQATHQGDTVQEEAFEVVLGEDLHVSIADELEEVHGIERQHRPGRRSRCRCG
jgi:hypothetical protein